jgi:Ankyrin repeats (many copies)
VTPLSYARRSGRLEIVKLLVETEGVDIDSKGKGGRTPLL